MPTQGTVSDCNSFSVAGILACGHASAQEFNRRRAVVLRSEKAVSE